MSKKARLVLVDGSAVFHRGYHALPPLSNRNGIPTNATLGYSTIILRVLSDLNPKYAIVAWDKSGDTFRKELYPEYKAHRKKQPDDLYAQMPYARKVTQALGLPFLELQNYEADDIIGTLGRQAERQGLETIIVTGDKDEFQLIDENTKVYTMRRGFTDTVIYDLAAMKERYGVTPKQFIDLKALMGDSSDNIPGVAGVGEKTAMNLLKQYGSLDGVYEHSDEIPGRLGERIRENKEVAYLSQKLSTIECNAPIKLDLEPAEVGKYNRQEIYDLFRDLEFKNLLSKLPVEITEQPNLFNTNVEPVAKLRDHIENANYEAITTSRQLQKMIGELANQKAFAFDTETDGLNDAACVLVGISISWQEGLAYYIPVNHKQGSQLSLKEIKAALKPIFENPKIGKVGHNAKFDYKVLCRYGMCPTPIVFDTMVAAFLINPLGRSQSLDDMAYRELGIEMIPISDLIGVGRNQITFDHVEILPATTYAAEDADISWRLYEKLMPELEKTGLNKLAQATEWPLIPVLGDMELKGIELDVEFLHKFNNTITKSIVELEEKIWEQAGQNFNISSPAQLAQILYGKLGLAIQGVKKGKAGGFSTAAKELEKLQDAHPIIPLISEYRELTKLKSTYVDALPQVADQDNRVHTNYSLTIAQTGRLSSNNPNLQNIPVRTEIGREIRKAFVASKGRVLISADYSQIELRVAAALAKDKGMIETFKQGIDLHLQTAAEMFGVSLEAVTKEQRYAAKTVNFGVLYGMSPHGLSVATGMTRDEANTFIARYFEIRKTLKEYIEHIKDFARKNEYTETLLGRRRPCPEINSNNFMIRSAAERVAVNVPIQGTAADIMKLAMVALNSRLLQGAHLLLQIHDELIVEADESQADEIKKLMKDIMENVYDLGVPISVDTASGKSWGEL